MKLQKEEKEERKNREKFLGISWEEEIEGFRQELLDFYDKRGRKLSWRENREPYRVWVSETMLQQTGVATVIPYYKRFIEELPSVKSLAACDEDRLLKLWEGLGYYSRVRNMKKAAVEIMENYGGRIPEKKEELIRLAGIGEYTSGAVASIAFEEPVVAVDGNVLRIMSRILATGGDIKRGKVKKRLTREVEMRISPHRPGDFNQAMMDLGATVCISSGLPRCGICPLSAYCRAFIEGAPHLYPEPSPKKLRRIEHKTVLLIRSPMGVGLRRRGPEGVLAGMWEFPTLKGHMGEETVRELLEEWGYSVRRLEMGPAGKHVFSHVQWEMISYYIEVPMNFCENHKNSLTFVSPKEMREKYALPSAFQLFKDKIKLKDG